MKPVISSDGRIFPSGKDAALAMEEEGRGAGYNSIVTRCASGQINNAYGLTWSFDLSRIPEFRKNTFSSQEIMCIENGMVFGNARMAMKWVASWRGKANHQCITQAVRTGKKSYGLHWRHTEKGAKAVRK